MNVWIFALSAVVFSPVIEPLGFSLDASTSVDAVSMEVMDVPMIDVATVELPGAPTMRYRGIEQLFEKLESTEK